MCKHVRLRTVICLLVPVILSFPVSSHAASFSNPPPPLLWKPLEILWNLLLKTGCDKGVINSDQICHQPVASALSGCGGDKGITIDPNGFCGQ